MVHGNNSIPQPEQSSVSHDAGLLVYIHGECTSCMSCENMVPEVFRVEDGACFILGDARQDAVTSANSKERSLLIKELPKT